MKRLKFRNYLVPLVLNGSKTTTWRLFDDKDLQAEDELILVNADTGVEFSKARILYVREKRLGDIEGSDFDEGHEKYENRENMLEEFQGYYGDKANFDSVVKIVKYQLQK